MPGLPRSHGVDLRMIARFLLTGGICYLTGLGTLVFAVENLRIHYVPANMMAFVIVISLGHFLNRHTTFGSHDRYLPELLRFALAMTLQAIAAVVLIALLVELGGLHYIAANIVVAALITAISFFVQRDFVYQRQEKNNSAGAEIR